MLLCVLLMAAQPVGVNLLPDPGFERGKWELANWQPCKSVREFSSPGRTGKRCVHLVGVSPGPGPINVLAISPPVKVEGGAEYLFSVWYRSAGEAEPFLGFVSFPRPFEEKGWETPRLQYENRPLPPSSNWRLGVWRIRVHPKAVEARLLLRLYGRGEVWFDDASFALVERVGVEPKVEGDFDADGSRVFVADVKAPSGLRWSLELRVDGRRAAVVGGEGPRRAVRLEFGAPDGAEVGVLLVNSDGGVPLDCAEFEAPPPAKIVLESPRYRASIYQTARPKFVALRLSVHVLPKLTKLVAYRAALHPAGSKPNFGPRRHLSDRSEALHFPAEGLSTGRWRATVEVKGPFGRRALTQEIRVLPRGRPHEVVIDDRNRLLVDGRPLFPRGFYGVPDSEELAAPVARAGYNVALTYGRDPEWCRRWLDVCQKVGLWGIVHVPRAFVGRFDERKLREAIRAVKSHPALLAYYLIDEPHPTRPGQKPEELRRIYEVVKDEDPYHPVTICINVPEYERLYLDCYDVLMIDVYPVRPRRSPLSIIADRMEHAWRSVEGRKPVWFIPQSFGHDIIEGLEGPPGYLTPSPEEEVAMHYLALTHGARGIVAYCYHVYTRYDPERKRQGRWPWILGGYLPNKQPRLWEALVELGRHYRILERALLAEMRRRAQFGSVHVQWSVLDGEIWLLAVNAGESSRARVDVPLSPERAPASAEARSALTGKVYKVEGGKVALDLPPLGVEAVVARGS